MSMLCRPMWPFLLMYESHDMRYISFPQVDGGQRDALGNGTGAPDITGFRGLTDCQPDPRDRGVT